MDNMDLYKTINYCVFAVLSFISVVENFRVISIVLTMPRGRRKDGNLLIAHLSLVTILLTFIDGDYMLLKFSDLEFYKASYVSCLIRSFTRNTAFCIVPLNVAAVNYEKTHAYKRNDPCGKFLAHRCIFLIWVTAVLGNIPSVFTIDFMSSSQQCKETFLLGSIYVASFYEILKVVLFNLVPVVYILYTLLHIRSVVFKHLLHSKRKVSKAARQNRLVFYHGLVFALLWLPAGILLLGHKIYTRLYLNGSKIEYEGPRDGTPSIIFMILNFVFLAYVSINPLIHLRLNERLSGVKWYQFTYRQQPKVSKPSVQAGIEDHLGQCETIRSNSYSRISTYFKSETPEPIPPLWNNPRREILL